MYTEEMFIGFFDASLVCLWKIFEFDNEIETSYL